MPSYDQVNAQADKEMADFLAGMSNPQSQQEQQEPPSQSTVKEEDFYADDDDELGGNTQVEQPETPPQPSNTQAQPTPQQAPSMYTLEQLEYERRLAEERGRSAAYNELVRSGAQVPQPQQQQPQPQGYFTADDLEFTPEELETFSPETQKFANKIANRALQRVLEQVVAPLQQEVLMQRQQLENYGQGVAKTNSQVLYSQVQQQVPDLPQIVASQEWRNFMEQPSPVDSSVPIKTVFLGHLHNGRQHDILNIIKMFKQQNPGSQTQMQMQAAPGQSSVGNPPTTIPSRKPKMFDYSKYQEAMQRWQAGKITYTEFSEIEKLFDKAMMEGRIKY